jgi:spore coat polysaccharide biosynthesis protein SpsF
MEALKTVPGDIRILACPDDCVLSFSPLAEKIGFKLCTGPKEDVLARYCTAIRRYSPDWVIRATGDNPFIFADAAETLTEETIFLDADYGSYTGLPLGAGVELIRAEALIRADREATKPEEREHVTPYLYNHADLFRLHRPLAPRKWQASLAPKLRLTIDTPEDYEYAQKLYRQLNEKAAVKTRYLGTTIIGAGL